MQRNEHVDAAGHGLQVRVLGAVEVLVGGVPAKVSGRRQLAVLAHLVIDRGRFVTADQLLDAVWEQAGEKAKSGSLRTYIWNLRKIVRSAESCGTELTTRGGAYCLHVPDDELDGARFEQLVIRARLQRDAGRPTEAHALVAEALGLWRGPAFGDLADLAFVQPEAIRLGERRLDAIELEAELALDLGRHAEVAAELDQVVQREPLRERLWYLLMLARYRAQRQADALRAFRDARHVLVEELGIEPGAELRELERLVLDQDPSLDWTGPVGVTRATGAEGSGPAASTEPGPATGAGGDASVIDLDGGPATGDGPAPTAGATTAGPAGAGLRGRLLAPGTDFVGRERELAEIDDRLERYRLVTLTGAGGCGKTRLALTIAERAAASARHELVWVVDLSTVTDDDAVPAAVGQVLGIGVADGDLDEAREVIGDRPALLVLDNCEHVVAGAADVIDRLLRAAPFLQILATSREELLLPIERVWRVPSMDLPPESALGMVSTADVSPFESVQLFLARMPEPLDADVDPDVLRTIGWICRRLDGIPLAIELAAALTSSLTITEIAQRLDDRFHLLTRGSRLAVPRQRTLAATLEWSLDLLDDEERRLFAALGVFAGPFELAAAEAVVGREVARRGLSSLVSKSMVVRMGDDGESRSRYRLLETMRHYAVELQDRTGVPDDVRRRHALHYAEFLEEAEANVHGPDAAAWLTRILDALANVREAFLWSLELDELDVGLRLAGALRWYYGRIGQLGEVADWFDQVLAREADLTDDQRLLAATGASCVAFARGDYRRTAELGDTGIELARALGDHRELSIALTVRCGAAVYEGNFERAEHCYREGVRLCADLGDRWGGAWLATLWSLVLTKQGELDEAAAALEGAMADFRVLQDDHGLILPLINRALLAAARGELDDARRWATEAVEVAVRSSDQQYAQAARCTLGRIELASGEQGPARELLLDCVVSGAGGEHNLIVARAAEGLAELAATVAADERALVLFGFAASLRRAHGIALTAQPPALAELAEGCGAAAVERAFERGAGLAVGEARALAREATATVAGPAEGSEVAV